MAETVVQSNNKAVAYRGRSEREMPSVSQAQNRFMHAVERGDVEGVSKSVGEKFVKADHGRKIGKLPKHVRKGVKHFAKRGMISDKQMRKMEG